VSDEPSHAHAGFGVRLVAVFIDGIAILLVERALVALFDVVGLVIALFLALAYFSYFEGSASGQSAGKRAMSIRVVDETTYQPIGAGRAALRFGARFVSMAALFVGYLWAIWDPQGQTWHDKIARTTVVSTDAYPVDTWP
jgi:uncharacterized RDD family membrane protein YckC